MDRVFQSFISLIWALWLGGLITLFIALQSLFHTFSVDPKIAGDAASDIFYRFNKYQLVLGLAALLATFTWRLMGPSRTKFAAFILFAIAGLAAAYVTKWLTPNIEMLRAGGHTGSADFKRLHGLSMAIYLGETIMVFLAGSLVTWVRPDSPIRSISPPRSTPTPDDR